MTVSAGTAYVDIKPNVDKFGSEVSKGIAGAFSRLGHIPGVEKFGKSLEKFSSGLAGTLTKTVTLPFLAIGGAAVESALKVEEAQNTIRQRTGATGKALEGLLDDFKAVGKQTTASFADVADVLTGVRQRLNLTGKPLQQLALTILRLNKVTGGTAPSVDEITKLFAQWNVETSKQIPTLDELFRATQKSGLGMESLVSTLQTFGPQLKTVGFSLKESAALLASLSKAGVDAGQVMGGLRKFFTQVAKAGKDPKQAFADIIKEIQDLSKQSTAFVGSQQEIADAQGKLAAIEEKLHGKRKLTIADEEKLAKAHANLAALLEVVSGKTAALNLGIRTFGTRGVGLVRAIEDGKFAFADFLKTIDKGGDTIGKAAQQTLTFGDRLKIFKNQATLALAPLGEKLFPLIQKTLGALLPVLVHVLGVLGNLPGPVLAVVAALAAFGPIVGLITAVGGAIVALGEAFGTAALFLAFNPFVALIAAIAIVTVVIIKFHKQIFAAFKAIGHVLVVAGKAMIRFFENLARPIIAFAKKFAPIILAVLFPPGLLILALVKFWKPIEGFFKDAIRVIAFILKPFVAVFVVTMKAITDIFKIGWVIITGLFKVWWAAFGPVVKGVLGLLVGFFKTDFRILEAVFRAVWSALKVVWNSIGRPLFTLIKTVIKTEFDAAKRIFSILADGFKAAWQVLNVIWRSTGLPIFNAIRTVVKSFYVFWRTIWGSFGRVFTSVWNTIKHAGLTAVIIILKGIALLVGGLGKLTSILRKIPGLGRIVPDLAAAAKAINALIGELQNVDSGPAPRSGGGGQRQFAASGGTFREGDWVWVGEHGKELVRFGQHARVIPHQRSMELVAHATQAGDTFNIVINNPKPEPSSQSLPAARRRMQLMRGR